MSVYTHVTSCSRKRLPFSVWNVLLRFRIAVLLGHSEVDDVNNVGRLCSWPSNQEIVRLDITVDQVSFVDSLNAGKLPGLLDLTWQFQVQSLLTICFATMTTVFIVNRL